MEDQLKEIRRLVEENKHDLKQIRRTLKVSAFFSFLRWLLILVPLILAAIYLPALVSDFKDSTNQFTQGDSGGNLPQGFSVDQIQGLLQGFER